MKKRKVDIIEVGNRKVRVTPALVSKTKLCAETFIDGEKTVRSTADALSYSKSAVHIYLRYFAPVVCGTRLNNKVQKLLDKNKVERAIRGGAATKEKYATIRKGRS